MRVEDFLQYAHIEDADTTTVALRSTGGVGLHAITVNDVGSGSLKVYDGTSSGTLVANINAESGVGQFVYDVLIASGRLTIVTDGQGDWTVTYL